MSRELNNKKNIFGITNICMLVCFFSNISYLPYFTTSGWTQYMSYPVWGLLIVVLFFYRSLYINRKDSIFLVIGMLVCILFFALEILTGKNYFESLLTRCIIIALVIWLVGSMVASMGESHFDENKIFGAYIVSAMVLSVVVYFTYLRGQDLSSSLYVYSSKNETAFINVTAIIMLLFIEKKGKRVHDFAKIVLVSFFIFVIAMMRCRSMLISAVLIVSVYLFTKNYSKKIKFAIILGMIGLIFALQNEEIYDTIINGIIFAARDSTNVNALSSGRVDQIDTALIKFSQNFFWGTGDTRTVDCFFVSVLMQYGIFVGTLFIVLACYPCIWGLKYYRKTKSNLCMIMLLCSLSYLIGGLFEENAPFGPGVRCYMSWFLFGYLRMIASNKYYKGGQYEKD